MYKCDLCNYSTNRIYNLKLHKNRKTPCNISNDDTISKTETISISCKKCNKIFYNKSSLNRHSKCCVGVNNLTCPICFETFDTSLKKFRHMNSDKCQQNDNYHQRFKIINNNNNNNNNSIHHNITNNTINTVNNNQNIHINCFGKEDLSYLLQDNNLIYKLNNYSKDGVYGFVNMIDEIYMNKDKPENNTILKLQERGDGVYIRNNDNWEYRDYEDVREELISSLEKYVENYQQIKEAYNIKLTEPKERKRIKRFLSTLMMLGGIPKEELCEELELAEENENDKTINKFDNATKDMIHRKSNTYWKKINGTIQKIVF